MLEALVPDSELCAREGESMNSARKLIGKYLKNPSIRIPAQVLWNVKDAGESIQLSLTIRAADLSRNIQCQLAATPSYLVCFAYWLEIVCQKPTTCRIRIEGEIPTEAKQIKHWRRSLFLINEMKILLRKRISVISPDNWQWPQQPYLNEKRQDRKNEQRKQHNPEHRLEISLCRSSKAAREFADKANVGAITRFERQLPVGLFGGEVGRNSHWTPGGGSQVDLWAQSRDGQTFHLFELKALDRAGRPNKPLGIIPEALYYLRLLHYVRVGISGGGSIIANNMDIQKLRSAKKIVMWLVAPEYHPLVINDGNSPIIWFNESMGSECSLRIMRIKLDANNEYAGWYNPSI